MATHSKLPTPKQVDSLVRQIKENPRQHARWLLLMSASKLIGERELRLKKLDIPYQAEERSGVKQEIEDVGHEIAKYINAYEEEVAELLTLTKLIQD